MNKSAGTISEYRYDLTNFLKYVGKKKGYEDISAIDAKFLNDLTLNDFYDFMAHLKNDCGDSPSTIYRKVESIKSFFKYLYSKAGIIENNTTRELEAPKIGKRLPKYLTLEQSTKLLNEVKYKEIKGKMHDNTPRDYAMIILFLNCGIRLSELVNINIGDIKIQESSISIIGKGNKERTIFLNKACMKAIKRYLKVRPEIDDDALFLSERGKRISRRTVQQIVKDYLKKVPGLDEKYSTHKLRHTAATLMYQYGDVDIRILQRVLGHESIQATEIYTHVDDDQVRSAIENNPLAYFK